MPAACDSVGEDTERNAGHTATLGCPTEKITPVPLCWYVVPLRMTRSSAGRSYAGAAVPLAALAGWLLQSNPGGDPGPRTDLLFENLVANGLGGALVTLIVGGLLIALATEYTDRNTRRIQREPGRTFLYGFGILIGFIIVFVALALTIVGLLVALPLALIGGIAFLIWGQLGYLTVGRLVTDEKWPTLGVAVGVAFLVGVVPGFGALVGFVIGSMGVGAGWIDFREDNRRPPRRRARRGPGPEWDEGGRGRRGGRGGPAGRGGRGGGDRAGGGPRAGGRSRGRGRQDRPSDTQGGRPSDTQGGHRDRGQHERGAWGTDDQSGGEGGWGTESEDNWGFDDDETWDEQGEDRDWSTTDDDVEWSSDEDEDDSGWL